MVDCFVGQVASSLAFMCYMMLCACVGDMLNDGSFKHVLVCLSVYLSLSMLVQ